MEHQGNKVTRLTFTGNRPLQMALAIVVLVMAVEAIGGILSHSLALLSDAGHMLVDALALGLTLFAITLARRPATATRTFGYHRIEIMAALVNGTILALVALYIFYEAYHRLLSPPAVRTPLMLSVAAVGLAANLAGILLLRRESRHSLNIRAAFWHIIGDTISSLGVIIAGIIIAFTGWTILDPVVAILIAVIILWGAVRLVRESADILLEAVPRDVQLDRIVQMIQSISGVENVHDIHIWTITSGMYALSAHLLVGDQMVSRSAEMVQVINRRLAREFNIAHTALQLECERCETCPPGLICEMARPGEPGDHHA